MPGTRSRVRWSLEQSEAITACRNIPHTWEEWWKHSLGNGNSGDTEGDSAAAPTGGGRQGAPAGSTAALLWARAVPAYPRASRPVPEYPGLSRTISQYPGLFQSILSYPRVARAIPVPEGHGRAAVRPGACSGLPTACCSAAAADSTAASFIRKVFKMWHGWDFEPYFVSLAVSEIWSKDFKDTTCSNFFKNLHGQKNFS